MPRQASGSPHAGPEWAVSSPRARGGHRSARVSWPGRLKEVPRDSVARDDPKQKS